MAAAPSIFARSRINSNQSAQTANSSGTLNLLTDPRYEVGARFRLNQFIQKGADPKEAESIFRRLTDLDASYWVAEWTRLAEPCETEAASYERAGKTVEARAAYLKASMYYAIAKFPVLNHPAKRAAYQKCVQTYLQGARYLDPPLERVTIPFAGKEIVGYLRLPKNATKPPVVITTGGVDVYKEERDTKDLLDVGLAAFATDMPGNGECPIWYTTNAEEFYIAVIDYLQKRDDLDGKRIGILGRSYGGYWGAKMAYVESKRLKAAVDWGGPIHYTFQPDWLRHLQDDKLYLWPIRDSFLYANHVTDLNELIEQAPALSLKTQGWLDKPACPILATNGAKDGWISIQDLYLLLESGDPKSARVYPDGGHMGGDPGTDKMVMNWLRDRLTA